MRFVLLITGIWIFSVARAQTFVVYDGPTKSFFTYDSTGLVKREQIENFITFKSTFTFYFPNGVRQMQYTVVYTDRFEYVDTLSEWSTSGNLKYMEIYSDSGHVEMRFDTNTYVIVSRGEFVKGNYDTTIFIHYDANHGINSAWCLTGCTYPIGNWVTFHDNGKIESEGAYMPYAMQSWEVLPEEDPNNPGLYIKVAVMLEAKFRDGIWHYYDDTGKEIREEYYEGGLLRSTIEF